MGVDDDWSEVEPPAFRSRVPTLVFYGAAPVCAPPVPPPLEPITRRLPVYDVSSSDLVDPESADGESDENDAEAHAQRAPRSARAKTTKAPEPPHETVHKAQSAAPWFAPSRQRSEPAPRASSHLPPLPRGGKLLIAALMGRRGVQVAALVTLAVLLTRPTSSRDATKVTRAVAPAFAPVSSGPVLPCTLGGAARQLAPRALISGGVELAPFGDSIALGYAAGPREGMAVRLDPSTLVVGARTKVLAARAIARVVPAPRSDQSLDVAADSDGERTFFDPTIGATYGLAEDATREAVRAVPLPGGAGYAVAFRRAGAIWFGVAAPDGRHLLRSAPAHVPGLGPQVGSPAIAVVGDVVMAAWADRAKTSDPWSVRWLSWKPGELPGEPQLFVPPAGGYGAHVMSPSIAALGAHTFLLVWTEGPVARHQVRAQPMTLEGAHLGPALPISEGTANAGQSQVAFASGGRGLVAFLAANEGSFAVLGTPLSCTTLP